MPADVHVITPTFRRPEALVEAIRSVLAQQGVTVSMEVLDDSPEGSARAAVEGVGDPRVRYTLRKKPSGGRPAVVRNEGFSRADGRYVHFLDDDDRVVPGAYQGMTAALDASPELGMIYGRIVPFGNDPGKLAQERKVFSEATRRARASERFRLGRFAVVNLLFVHPILVNSACLVRPEAVRSAGGYDEQLPTVEDLDFFLRVMRRSGGAFLDRDVIEYRCGEASLMSEAEKDQASIREAYRRIYAKYRDERGALELAALKLLGRGLLRWI